MNPTSFLPGELWAVVTVLLTTATSHHIGLVQAKSHFTLSAKHRTCAFVSRIGRAFSSSEEVANSQRHHVVSNKKLYRKRDHCRVRDHSLPSISAFPTSQSSFASCHQSLSSSLLQASRDNDSSDNTVDIPLIFLHGMKGSHLATNVEHKNPTDKAQRSWLSLGGLLNFPPRADDHPERDISLPLSYVNASKSFPVQDRGRHFVDGTVDHVVQLGTILPGNTVKNTGNLDFFPFYGHATKFLEQLDKAYNNHDHNDAKSNNNVGANHPEVQMSPRPTRSFCYDWRRNLNELTEEFYEFCEAEFPSQEVQILAHSMGGLITYAAMKKHPHKFAPGGVLVGVPFGTGIQYLQDVHKGYFTELGTCRQFLPPAQFTFSSHWSFFPIGPEEIGDSFVDVSEYFEAANGNTTSIAFEADRSTIGKKTSSSSSENEEKWRAATPGAPIPIDFYDPDEWERNEIGIFDPVYRHSMDPDRIDEYKAHMKVQMEDAKRWRTIVMAPWEDEDAARNHPMPPLTVCSTISVPTPNQILRRKRRVPSATGGIKPKGYDFFPRSLISLFEKATEKEETPDSFPRSLISLLEKATQENENESSFSQAQPTYCQWEYDYASGRTVRGDGRVDYDKSFPPKGTSFKRVDLDSLHAKQCCWEDTGGDLAKVFKEVNEQLENYLRSNKSSTNKSQAEIEEFSSTLSTPKS